MLKPYIVEKGIIRIIGKSVSFGGDRAKTGEIGDLFANRKEILDCILNRPDEYFYGDGANLTLAVPII